MSKNVRVFSVRTTEDEYSKIYAESKKLSMTVSQYCREKIINFNREEIVSNLEKRFHEIEKQHLISNEMLFHLVNSKNELFKKISSLEEEINHGIK